MLKKIFIGIMIVVALVLVVGGFFYWRFTQANKPPISDEDRAKLFLMPLPSEAVLKNGEFQISPSQQVIWSGVSDERFQKAWLRFTGTLTKSEAASPGRVEITCDSASNPVQQVVENESYTLSISSGKVSLHASSPYGVLRGLETLKQLVTSRDGKSFLPAIEIEDNARYPWRGILIDVGRHWIPKEVILRNLDAMAAVKMNVLHWHLTEYQGFRVESKIFPKLHELGSEGNYYTQEDIREVVAYAHDLGIRVVPEFDLPGHSTSWFVGHPELASKPGPYKLDTKFGLLPPVMDPSREEVYSFLDKFIGEMSDLFPDPYMHIGGDEVVPEDWNKSESIQAFMKSQDMMDHHDLQNYFNTRLKDILRGHGKKMIGWDEILHPDLGSGVTVQSWRSQRSLFEAVQKGSEAILSAGFYLDHKLPAGKHYSVDPEIMRGGVTITPDTLNWKEYSLDLKVSEEAPMEMNLILYGQPAELRGVFMMMENATGFETASLQGEDLTFSFVSEFGTIDVEAKLNGDSISGKMSLGFLSFPFKGKKSGGSDIAGTKPPEIQRIKPLSEDDKSRILGGEAAMWTELVSHQNIESRIWPRAAAIAEKLWSPAVLTKNTDDMYRRLEHMSNRLEELGLRHRSGPDAILAGIAGNHPVEPLRVLAETLEEAKYYARMTMYPDLSTLTPLDEFVDAVQPESYAAYDLLKKCETFVADPIRQKNANEIAAALRRYITNDDKIKTIAAGNPRLEKVLVLSAGVKELGEMGLKATSILQKKESIDDSEKARLLERLRELEKPEHGMVIAILPAVRVLVSNTK